MRNYLFWLQWAAGYRAVCLCIFDGVSPYLKQLLDHCCHLHLLHPFIFKEKWNNRFLRLSLHLKISPEDDVSCPTPPQQQLWTNPPAAAHWKMRILITFYHTDMLNCLPISMHLLNIEFITTHTHKSLNLNLCRSSTFNLPSYIYPQLASISEYCDIRASTVATPFVAIAHY